MPDTPATEAVQPHHARVWRNGYGTRISKDEANAMPAWELYARSYAAADHPTQGVLVRDLLDAYDRQRAANAQLRADRDRLIAQVERVRALIVDYEAVFEHGQCGDDCNLCAAHDFRSALDNPDLGSTQDGADR